MTNEEKVDINNYKEIVKYMINYYNKITTDKKYENDYSKKVTIEAVKEMSNKKGIYTVNDFIEGYKKFYKDYLFNNDNLDDDIVKSITENPPENFLVNWEILPSGHRINKKIKEVQVRNLKTTGNLKTSKGELDQKRNNLLFEKDSFFKSTSPIMCIKGKDGLSNYYGFIYRNGKVIFEKYFKDQQNLVPAIDEAIYVMNFDNFEEMSKHEKPEIIEYISKNKNINARRIYHSKNWKTRVISVIKEKTSITGQDLKKVLIREETINNKLKKLYKLRRVLLEKKHKNSYDKTPKIKEYQFHK